MWDMPSPSGEGKDAIPSLSLGKQEEVRGRTAASSEKCEVRSASAEEGSYLQGSEGGIAV